ncbi:MAG: DUF952 domain-containing protein [Acidimicrobiales bacterium]
MNGREGVSRARTKPNGTTLHLAPRAAWEAQRVLGVYVPEQFPTDGFIHCTDGQEQLLVPANAYFRDDPRPYVALVIDLDRVMVPVRYDDDPCIYPHIYGPLDTTAVVEVLAARRGADGTFLGFTSEA